MAEEKQLSSCDPLYVVGYNQNGELGLGHRTDVTDMTEWTADNDNDTFPTSTSVHTGDDFAILVADNRNLSPLTFGFIRETCDGVPAEKYVIGDTLRFHSSLPTPH